MDISIIISTWNNGARLRATLEALCDCCHPDAAAWEVVLVNNHCTDDTDAVAAAYRDRLPLVYVHEPKPGLSNGRNAGLAAATGRLILFADDDIQPCRDWIAVYWRAYCQTPRGRYFGGPIQSQFEGAPPAPSLARIAPPSIAGLNWGSCQRQLTAKEFFVASNWACPSEALAKVGGFDPALGLNPAAGMVRVGEETELMQRLEAVGWKPWYLPEARIAHFVPAAKCTMEHILSRRQAQIRQDALARIGLKPDQSSTTAQRLKLRGLAAAAWMKWRAARALGGHGLWFEAQWRGYTSALRELS